MNFSTIFSTQKKTDESQNDASATALSTKNIIRIVNDRICLCYFVQYLDQKSALPLIKFWMDVESFKSSLEQCSNSNINNNNNQKRFGAKHGLFNDEAKIVRSISLDGNMLMDRDDFCATYNGQSMEKLDEILAERDNGDGSSDAQSMTNSSDICERNNDEQIESVSFDHCDDYYDSNRASKIDMNGRKSATGASADGDDDTEDNTHSKLSTSGTNPTSSILDAIRIFKKYLLNGELTSLVHIPTNILSQISLVLCVQGEQKNSQRFDEDDNIAEEKLSFSNESLAMSTAQLEEVNIETVFDDAQTFVLNYLDATYTSGFLESAFYYRFCVENLGYNLKITDILYNETALFYFMEFLENQNRRHYLDFWVTAMNFRRQLLNQYNLTKISVSKECKANRDDNENATDRDANTNEQQQSQNDALILYDKYISLQATCPLNLCDAVRFNIEEKICSVDGNATIAHSFDLPLKVIERFLSVKYLRAFERSNLFCKYKMEMMKKIETSTKSTSTSDPANELNRTHNNRKSIDFSISSRNTLLAMESSKRTGLNQRIKTSASDMNIDARQLHDPDLLWRRNFMNGLNFGRVNALGRYERDYDMTPCAERNSGMLNSTCATSHDTNQILQQTSNKIKRAVRKLVHIPEQNAQEELAWQMAELIVKDITNVTLHSHELQK